MHVQVAGSSLHEGLGPESHAERNLEWGGAQEEGLGTFNPPFPVPSCAPLIKYVYADCHIIIIIIISGSGSGVVLVLVAVSLLEGMPWGERRMSRRGEPCTLSGP